MRKRRHTPPAFKGAHFVNFAALSGRVRGLMPGGFIAAHQVGDQSVYKPLCLLKENMVELAQVSEIRMTPDFADDTIADSFMMSSIRWTS